SAKERIHQAVVYGLVEPPWRPAVLWDRVTLTCQGSGTAGATTWYKDGRRWGQQRQDRLTVTESGTYKCDRPGSGHSPVVRVLDGEGATDHMFQESFLHAILQIKFIYFMFSQGPPVLWFDNS
uniref:Ig-like domain-containing protein n=1 Tax=Zonotrichia albicollis TaxID=44394 RepID=A0A8D2M100_ZONAL